MIIINIIGEIVKKILYVEDLQDSIKLVEHFCRGIYEVDSATDVESAIEKVKTNSFDIILMDINLKQPMDGLMLTKYLRNENLFVDKPIVALTAYKIPADIENLKLTGLDGVIMKPIIKSDLLSKLSDFL